MNKENILFVVEGAVREMGIVDNIRNVFFKKSQIKIIPIPASKNIYMLWKILKNDEFETDIIEVLKEDASVDTSEIEDMERDDFSEVYLFFDYDGHQNNLNDNEAESDVIEEMLRTFDNETEAGKLYISYPMVEALRDIVVGECRSIRGCYIPIDRIGDYKRISSKGENTKNQSRYTIEDWREIITAFALKLACLNNLTAVMSYDQYKASVFPLEIYYFQKKRFEYNDVFVLSAFPEFLLDYNRDPFWYNMIKKTITNRGKGMSCE
ncbi:hypothetical protein [Butyrivibrio sp. WCE2006]|uniref:hypothetical protein n=1 Tax=Butyrivibrio sp. WCE2006 TaxID=1410611 RepID=UPI0006798ECF|nr:hypothetical protein [Butyrivibrio sp. WCE2006]